VIGRVLLDRRASSAASVPPVPAAAEPAAALPAGAELSVDGITPLIVSNRSFYRIDTSLLVPRLDATEWRLAVNGMVAQPFEIDYAQLLAMPLVEQYVTIACVSNEVGGDLVGNAVWRGVPLRDLLDRAGVEPGATQVVGRAFDGWTAGFPTAWVDAPEREALVAVAMNGEPLPPEHGFPARLIVPGLFGYVSATKWLTNIELTTLEAFDAYWVPLGWAKEAPVLTQSRIDVPRNGASIGSGRQPVAGVAWAPDRGVAGVEVQVDDQQWATAEISTPISDATWVQWLYRWEATPGQHTLRVRATDGDGQVQTAQVTRPPPDGARGHHTIRVTVG
jgi:DMSO/TMAO reductase YedYZ molybdopterin-dependent catalytic subunit